MKHTLIFFAVVLGTLSAHAQTLKDSEIPSTVREAFMKKFSNAKDVKWSKESEKEFEAEFKNGSMEQAANFDEMGKWLITETEIKKSELPAAVTASLKKEFADYKIEEVEKADTPDKGIFYEVEVEKGKMTYVVQLSPAGKVIKKEEKKEEKE